MTSLLSNGSSFGRYRIFARIGAGAQGHVYRARDTRDGRTVALKILHGGQGLDASTRKRFDREGAILAKLNHKHIVKLYDVGVEEGHPYFTMDYVEGLDLSQLLADRGQKGLPVDFAVQIIEQVASALDAAHAAKLLHRDIKPANILIEQDPPGDVYLTDFGIATEAGAPPLTRTSALIGTLAYTAPERFRERSQVDRRADIYSLGCVLYEALTGDAPFTAQDFPGWIAAHLYSAPPKPSTMRPTTVSVAFDSVIECALAKNPLHRFGTASELASAARIAMESELPLPASQILIDQSAPSEVARKRSYEPTRNAETTQRAALTAFLLRAFQPTMIADVAPGPVGKNPEAKRDVKTPSSPAAVKRGAFPPLALALALFLILTNSWWSSKASEIVNQWTSGGSSQASNQFVDWHEEFDEDFCPSVPFEVAGQKWTVGLLSSDTDCGTVHVFSGEDRIAEFSVPRPAYSVDILVHVGDSPSSSYVALIDDDATPMLVGFAVSDPATQWTRPIGTQAAMLAFQDGPVIGTSEAIDAEDSVIGISMSSGEIVWSANCPEGFTRDGLRLAESEESSRPGMVMVCDRIPPPYGAEGNLFLVAGDGIVVDIPDDA
ncbi:serine/threonine-protein kinase [Pseudonocardia broussonetiae]|uniref:non-specific serine/threonine protein kinase n=1 Tax=Pseudonocardia broussonetiae TaxID=2736640 RepID=A0A6M6JB34_9PSEU|nr:serine/threonine-protein kinase [Pseudonocardia broussonetiae]QJY45148.1 serine/threonine protein kinase [Pseudonocardia broussonetiae]